jgi:uncharacterized membrane protein AbrB (regulator of aidB expression)
VYSASSTDASQPGWSRDPLLAAPVTVSPSLSVPWGDVLVGIEFAVTVSEWAVDSLGDALVFSVLGVVLLLVTLNLVNLGAWLFRRYTDTLLGDPMRVLSRLPGSRS